MSDCGILVWGRELLVPCRKQPAATAAPMKPSRVIKPETRNFAQGVSCPPSRYLRPSSEIAVLGSCEQPRPESFVWWCRCPFTSSNKYYKLVLLIFFYKCTLNFSFCGSIELLYSYVLLFILLDYDIQALLFFFVFYSYILIYLSTNERWFKDVADAFPSTTS